MVFAKPKPIHPDPDPRPNLEGDDEADEDEERHGRVDGHLPHAGVLGVVDQHLAGGRVGVGVGLG